jgi:hypothetical protein
MLVSMIMHPELWIITQSGKRIEELTEDYGDPF